MVGLLPPKITTNWANKVNQNRVRIVFKYIFLEILMVVLKKVVRRKVLFQGFKNYSLRCLFKLISVKKGSICIVYYYKF